MKWTKNKIAENCYSFFAKDKKTKFDFCVCYNAGDIELSAWYGKDDDPYWEFFTKTPLDFKAFCAQELEPFKRSLIRGTWGKMLNDAEYLKEILYNLEK